MKKFFLFAAAFFVFCGSVFAFDEAQVFKEKGIQNKIDTIGAKILNANKIEKRIIFVYDNAQKKSKLDLSDSVTSRQVVVYDRAFKYAQSDDELAGFLAREIFLAMRSFDGHFAGGLSTVQVKAAPKKYEMVADKRAVDLMVNAGYDPVGLIIYIQKTAPQKRFDRFSNRNLTSKRLAVIYEYIYTKYPYYLLNNKYLENEHYQNFLLTSRHNRALLEEKIKTKSREELNYE